MSDKQVQKVKFIPKLSQIQEAAAQLPSPETSEAFFEAKLEGSGKTIVFERVEASSADGKKVNKWTFKGRMFIDTRFLKNLG